METVEIYGKMVKNTQEIAKDFSLQRKIDFLLDSG
jgi:hypothetical protein